ncbi:MAG: isoprenylcysteine carboxylmethyltransferase family protein [Candidatus Omnitrophica bacterium]|nr:isoprenylcysteine carboxylmethyltransferase family protein [Candidatus Omnitrophota bacterium]
MTELSRIRLKTLGWFILFPLPFIGIVPWWLHGHLEGPFRWEGGWRQWLGLWLILNGLGLAGWCVHLFTTQGRGTPVPLDPPKQFVATGPYRVVRNPMALGLFLILAGEAALYQSRAAFCYLLLVIGLMHLVVRLVEEPDLQRRFGSSYAAYRQQVPRWIPRPIPGARQPQTR